MSQFSQVPIHCRAGSEVPEREREGEVKKFKLNLWGGGAWLRMPLTPVLGRQDRPISVSLSLTGREVEDSHGSTQRNLVSKRQKTNKKE